MGIFISAFFYLGEFFYFDEKGTDWFNANSVRSSSDVNYRFKSLQQIKKKHWKHIAITAALGTFFPAFFFAFAIVKIDSSIASILNSFTPFNTFIFGALVFGFSFNRKQLTGILVGLIGTVILILKGAALNPTQNYWYAILILIASVGYAFNVNIVKKYLSDVSALAITTGNFLLLIVPAFLVLAFSGFFSSFEINETTTPALGHVLILSVVGTGIAKVLFNKLVHISTPVFSSFCSSFFISSRSISYKPYSQESSSSKCLGARLITDRELEELMEAHGIDK